MTKTRLLIKNVCYHLFARGNQKQSIFKDEEDFRFYLSRLRHYKRKHSFLLYGYCLMPNHIHLIGQPTKPEELSKFMQGLQRSYAAYYNNKYSKVGHLWQSRFKNKIIAKDQYLIDCITYIELNPVRANIVTSPREFKFSSYSERTLNDSQNGKLLDTLLI